MFLNVIITCISTSVTETGIKQSTEYRKIISRDSRSPEFSQLLLVSALTNTAQMQAQQEFFNYLN
jgi:hypothetical protein